MRMRTDDPDGQPYRPVVPTDYSSIRTGAKADEAFRIYDEVTSERRVVEHYRDMRAFQTVAFYRRMESKYSFENGQYRRLMTVEEAFEELERYVVSCLSDAKVTDLSRIIGTSRSR